MDDPSPFDLDAGRPCLDFANTQSFDGHDHLGSYADLVAFVVQSHLLTPKAAAALLALAQRRRGAAAATLVRARVLRQALRGIFGAVANRQRPPAADLDVLNTNLAASLAHARVLPDPAADDAYAWGWVGTDADLTSPLWPITRSAAELLTSHTDRPLVRECGAADCAWLFIDATRNRSRQWCSMTSCGNREKARRHYQRLRAQRTVEPAAAAAGQRPERRAPRTRAGRAGGASATAG